MSWRPAWWPRRRACHNCRHTTATPGCGCRSEGCVCMVGRRVWFNQAMSTLSPRDQQWFQVNRRRLSDLLDASNLDPDELRRLPTDDATAALAAHLDIAVIRRIINHEIAEADDPAAMQRLLWHLTRRPDSD